MIPQHRPFEQFGPDEPEHPVVISVPHAGRDYPAPLLAMSRVPAEVLRTLEDRYADALAGLAIDSGYTVLIATRARAWIDLNRDPREIDADMIDPPLPRHGVHRSAKVNGGLGLIPRRLRGHSELWRYKLPREDLDRRIAEDHRPFHDRLSALLAAARRRFGIAVLLDLHSMPPLAGEQPRSIVIGDLFGRSASARFAAAAREVCDQAGHSSAQNSPYAGGYVIAAHGEPARNVHALQIEVDRSLYLDRAMERPGPDLAAMADVVLGIARALGDEAIGSAQAIAAE